MTAGTSRRPPDDQARIRQAFEPVVRQFESYLDDPSYSGQLAVYWRGELALNLAGGRLSTGTLTGLLSAGKGIAGLCVGELVQSGELNLDEPVAHYWPEFAHNGKRSITVRQALTHRAGVVSIPGGFTSADLANGWPARQRLATASPQWQPGSVHGYHALTIGMLIEELFLRIRGITFQEHYRDEYLPLTSGNLYFGLPASEDGRYLPIEPPTLTAEQQVEQSAQPPREPESIAGWSFNRHARNGDGTPVDLSPNDVAIRRFGGVGHAGVGNALGLASAYAHFVTGVGGQQPRLTSATLSEIGMTHSWGTDAVLGAESAFAVVFMKPSRRVPFGSHRAVGHDGAGGALGFADPEFDLAVGYVPHPQQFPGGADDRILELAKTLRDAVRTTAEQS